MAKKKLVLDTGDQQDYFLAGISCHQKEFRFVWGLDQVLESKFEKEPDYQIKTSSGEDASFPFYIWEEPEGHFTYFVLGNRSPAGTLIPEFKHADYIFAITGLYGQLDTDAICEQIGSLKMVLTVFEIDPQKTKSTKNLILE
ncbi:IPExxxVDY family protein [Salibacter halophilus]|uniref:IPExxxVDY family protein n=1 Tax=Salibacter halophilus TaxID=1803916 RepID=A0A6N6M5N2_9FLAO|nr:IPExxxVDY family protein [Salibacter halophilus]KAB1063663.1 IPExxxVDY family protein [Salibacter halophilus]